MWFALLKKELSSIWVFGLAAVAGFSVWVMIDLQSSLAASCASSLGSCASCLVSIPFYNGRLERALVLQALFLMCFLVIKLVKKEYDSDTISLLLHLPMERSRMILTKMAAGMIVYSGSMSASVLIYTFCAVIPGNYPSPFFPSMLWIAFPSIISGLVLYFGVMLPQLLDENDKTNNPALAFPAITAAFMASISLTTMWSTRSGAILAFLTICVFIICNVDFIGRQRSRTSNISMRFSTLAKLLYAAVSGIGVIILAGFLWFWCASFIDARISPPKPRDLSQKFVPGGIDVQSDGNLLYRGSITNSPEVGSNVVYRDLEGRDVPDPANLVTPFYLWNMEWKRSKELPYYSAFPGAQNRLLALVDMNVIPIYWSFLFDGKENGKGYFIGYDSMTRKRIGYIGKKGFSEQLPSEEDRFGIANKDLSIPPLFDTSQSSRFDAPSYPQSYLLGKESWKINFIADGKAWRVNLRERTTELIPFPNTDEPLGICYHWTGRYEKKDKPLRTAIRTKTHFYVLEPDDTLSFDAVIPEKIRETPFLYFYCLADESVLACTGTYRQPVRNIYRFDRAGNIFSTQRMDFPQFAKKTPDLPPGISFLTILTSPIATNLSLLFAQQIEKLVSENVLFDVLFGDTIRGLRPTLSANLWAWLAFSHLHTLLWALIAWMHEKFYAVPGRERKIWFVFVYLLGLPALFGYLLHTRWPRLEKCSSCQTRTPVDYPSCRACGSDWPLPERKGTEIYG